jgi:hypothetical protein
MSGQAFLTGTTVHGQYALRVCIVNPRSTPVDVERLVSLVRRSGPQG